MSVARVVSFREDQNNELRVYVTNIPSSVEVTLSVHVRSWCYSAVFIGSPLVLILDLFNNLGFTTGSLFHYLAFDPRVITVGLSDFQPWQAWSSISLDPEITYGENRELIPIHFEVPNSLRFEFALWISQLVTFSDKSSLMWCKHMVFRYMNKNYSPETNGIPSLKVTNCLVKT